jgi:hypothetical protein
MNSLLLGSHPLGFSSLNISKSMSKSGNCTPAPTTKVLKWKDLETPVGAESEPGTLSNQRNIARPYEIPQEIFNGDMLWSNDRDMEELFV